MGPGAVGGDPGPFVIRVSRICEGAVFAVTHDVMRELSKPLLFWEKSCGVLDPPHLGAEPFYELQAPAGRLEAFLQSTRGER